MNDISKQDIGALIKLQEAETQIVILRDVLKKVEKFCKVVSTNSVPSRVSKIDVSEVFSLALKRYLTEKPIREIDELF